MKAVIQQESTGCAIACTAAITGIDYQTAKHQANKLGIIASDKSIWSSTQPIRHLLEELGVVTAPSESIFTTWEQLPSCALLALKWHTDNDIPYWHWAVFVREHHTSYVLDSNKSLKTNTRTDFGRMKPKWFIEVYR